jgi:hypothetical protein
MADATFANTKDALEQRVRQKLVRQPNRSTVLLNLLQKSQRVGKNYAFDVSFGTSTGAQVDDGADVSTFNNDDEKMAVLDWAHIQDAFAVTGTAEDAAAGEPTELANLYMKKLLDSINRLADKVNTDAWTGLGTASPQKLHGLTADNGPLDNDGTYATIDRAVFTQWASNRDETVGPLTITRLETMLETIYTASGKMPWFAVTTPTLWRRYAELIAPEKRYVQEVSIRGETIILDGGWQALELNGIPIFKDRVCPAGHWAWVNGEHMGLTSLPPASRLMTASGGYAGQVPIAGTPQEQAGAIPGAPGLMARVIPLSRAGDKSKYQLLWKGVLWSDRCNAHGLMKNVTV